MLCVQVNNYLFRIIWLREVYVNSKHIFELLKQICKYLNPTRLNNSGTRNPKLSGRFIRNPNTKCATRHSPNTRYACRYIYSHHNRPLIAAAAEGTARGWRLYGRYFRPTAYSRHFYGRLREWSMLTARYCAMYGSRACMVKPLSS